MATPAQLAQTISSATGVPLPTVIDIDRKLVKAGLRTKGGRGFSAAQMTSLDAARLLVAVLGSPQANTSAEAVERYATTVPDKALSSEKLFATAMLDDLATLPTRHSFVEALAALITSVATGSLATMIAKGATPSIEVFAFTRATRGRIRVAGLPNGLTASIEYVRATAGKAKRPHSRGNQTNQASGDLEQSRRISERTILPIAYLLAKDSQHDRD
ncbi:MAG: hypothetical protein WAL80_20275 [Xanthobacteraceae bacterium]